MENKNSNSQNSNSQTIIKGVISLIIIVVVVYFFFGGGIEKQAEKDMAVIENKVAKDAEAQYNIAKSGGDKMDIYVHASMVAAAYLQAKDSVNYLKWKSIEKADAKAANVPTN